MYAMTRQNRKREIGTCRPIPPPGNFPRLDLSPHHRQKPDKRRNRLKPRIHIAIHRDSESAQPCMTLQGFLFPSFRKNCQRRGFVMP